MGDPHNPSRYGETWPQHRLDAYMAVLDTVQPFVVLSGGWAWHFMSPPGHVEYKHAHDHKDVDIFARPENVGVLVGMFKGLGFEKVATKYDRLPSAEDFRRYEKVVESDEHDPFRLTIDFFVKPVPSIVTPSGFHVVHPAALLLFYSRIGHDGIHSSDNCWAVQTMSRWIANGGDPEKLIGMPLLSFCPDLDVFLCTTCSWVGQFPKQWQGIHICPSCDKYVCNTGKPDYKP